MVIPEPIKCSFEQIGGKQGILSNLPDDKIIKEQSKIHNALSSQIRLKILNMLLIQPLCVCLIKEITGIPDSKLSYHLSILTDSGLVCREKTGNWIIYHATDEGRKYKVG